MVQENIKKLLANHERRLQKLMEVEALEGRDTSPATLIEIEDIKAAIEELEESLKTLNESRFNKKSLEREPELVEAIKPKQRVQIYLEGDFSIVPADRWAAAIDAFAAIMLIPPQAIEVRRIYEGSIVFDLDIPFDAAQRFRFLLESNSALLRLLKTKKVVFEKSPGESEEWIAKGRAFHKLEDLPLISSAFWRTVRERFENGEYQQVAKLLYQAAISSRQSNVEKSSRRELEFFQHLLGILALFDQGDVTPAITSAISVPETHSSVDLVTKSQKIQSQPSLKVYCLGSFRVYQNDELITNWTSLKAMSLFKYLVAHRNTPVRRDILMDVFWPDAEPGAARRNLHQAIYVLRQTLKHSLTKFQPIQFENDSYFFHPDLDVWLDFVEFQKHVEAGQSLETVGNPESAEIKYRQAIELYQGDFLKEDMYEEWTEAQREQLRQMFLYVCDSLSEYYIQHGSYADVINLSQIILTHERLHEAAHRRLMQSYIIEGQYSLAVRQYHLYVQELRDELGVAPSSEMQAFYKEFAGETRSIEIRDRK